MEYRQSFDKDALLSTDIDTALDSIRAELAENLLKINNEHCSVKLPIIADVFSKGFPASQDYDPIIEGIVPLGKTIIVLSHGTEGLSEYYKKQLLGTFLVQREELKNAMKNI